MITPDKIKDPLKYVFHASAVVNDIVSRHKFMFLVANPTNDLILMLILSRF